VVLAVIHYHNMDQQVVYLDDDRKVYKTKILKKIISFKKNFLTESNHNYQAEHVKINHGNDAFLLVHYHYYLHNLLHHIQNHNHYHVYRHNNVLNLIEYHKNEFDHKHHDQLKYYHKVEYHYEPMLKHYDVLDHRHHHHLMHLNYIEIHHYYCLFLQYEHEN